MIHEDIGTVYQVSWIEAETKVQIIAYMQGAVYCWCKNKAREWFAAHDLFGGENFHWEGTPLYSVYLHHIDEGHNNESAIELAGQDVGKLLKELLSRDKRNFHTRNGYTREYSWDGTENNDVSWEDII